MVLNMVTLVVGVLGKRGYGGLRGYVWLRGYVLITNNGYMVTSYLLPK